MSEQRVEQRVRAVWRFFNYSEPDADCDIAIVQIVTSRGVNEFTDKDPKMAWDAALVFTESRLEEVRQLREEIALLRQYCDWCGIIDSGYPLGHQDAKDNARMNRTVSRLESILAEKTAGMRPEALSPTQP